MTRSLIVLAALAACGNVAHEGPDAAPPDALGPQVVPSNSAVTGELQPTGLVLAVATATFDTDGECTAAASIGRCSVVPRNGLAELCVCRVDTLTIDTLHVQGKRALAILAFDSVTVHTLLDVSANRSTPGPGATRVSTGGPATGGSFGSRGGSDANVAPVADLYGTPELIPLEAGMTAPANGSVANPIAGGGGGGALQITANARIDVLGVIAAGGGGGAPNTLQWAEGAGGGSGGAILLEARVVSVAGGLAANGGGGGGAGGLSSAGQTDSVGQAGASGTDPLHAAAGGTGGAGGCRVGTTGGVGSLGAVEGHRGFSGGATCAGVSSGTSGGGGGGGRIRINAVGSCACTGAASPPPSYGPVVIR